MHTWYIFSKSYFINNPHLSSKGKDKVCCSGMHGRLVVSSIIYGGSTEYAATVCRSPCFTLAFWCVHGSEIISSRPEAQNCAVFLKKSNAECSNALFFFFFFQLKTTPVWKALFEGLTPCTDFIVRADPVRQSPT